jgi:hypothetical protein
MCQNSYMSWDVLSKVNMKNTPTLVTLTICTLGSESMFRHKFVLVYSTLPSTYQSPTHTTVLYPTCKFAISLPTLILCMPYFSICPAVFWHIAASSCKLRSVLVQLTVWKLSSAWLISALHYVRIGVNRRRDACRSCDWWSCTLTCILLLRQIYRTWWQHSCG